MAFQQNERTKKFAIAVQYLLDNGLEKSKTEIAKNIKYARTALSNVLAGVRNVPNDVYIRFTKRYSNVNIDTFVIADDQLATKPQTAIQEENKNLRNENELLRNSIRANEKLNKVIELMQQQSEGLQGLSQKIDEIALDGSTRAAIHAQYQEYLVSKLDHNVDAAAKVVELQRKAFERMTNVRITDTPIAQGSEHSTAT